MSSIWALPLQFSKDDAHVIANCNPRQVEDSVPNQRLYHHRSVSNFAFGGGEAKREFHRGSSF